MPRKMVNPFHFKCPSCGEKEKRGARKRLMKSCGSEECKKKAKSMAIKKRHKDPLQSRKMTTGFNGKRNPRWRPIGTKVNARGYIIVKIGENNWKREHIYVMEEFLKREIDCKKECVHHIDGNKSSNNLPNLCLMTHREHKQLHQSVFMSLVHKLLKQDIIFFDKTKKRYNLKK